MKTPVLFYVLLGLAFLQGCAGFDEWKCGGRGYAYTNGVCKGFGGGFTAHEASPSGARSMLRARND